MDSLQQKFQNFQRRRYENYKFQKYNHQTKRIDKEQLRGKFIEQAKKYMGVPYAARYHEDPNDPHHNSPLYLDCSGLIRQIIYDLREDFGFTLGKWNQAYQYDILDKEIEFEQMKPGDLVFISGKYFLKNQRPFQHNMVHVEIYTGIGEQKEGTIGARWQKGFIQEFDSYKFISKNYGVMKYHFKSIDPWLNGIFKSFCSEHDWRDDRNVWISDKYSVFSKCNEEYKEGIEQQKKKLVYVGEGNNAKLIKGYFEKQPDEYQLLDQEKDGFRLDYYFKWVQSPAHVNFFDFKNQIVNHIACVRDTLGIKNKMKQILKDFQVDWISSDDFIPQSYSLDILSETIEFMNNQQEGIWILKEFNLNQGKGIQIIEDIKQFKRDLQKGKQYQIGDYYKLYIKPEVKEEVNFDEEVKYKDINGKSIIQKYIEKPLLLNQRKFDLRCYVLIACVKPYFVLFSPGYARLSLLEYNTQDIENKDNQVIHLTNAAIQKQHQLYKNMKDNVIWSMDQVQSYLGCDLETLMIKIKQMMSFSFMSIKNAVQQSGQNGQFEFCGVDILLDSDLSPYLLEINVNPALFTDNNSLKQILPQKIESLLNLEVKVHKNIQECEKVVREMKDKSFDDFEVIINESIEYIFK